MPSLPRKPSTAPARPLPYSHSLSFSLFSPIPSHRASPLPYKHLSARIRNRAFFITRMPILLTPKTSEMLKKIHPHNPLFNISLLRYEFGLSSVKVRSNFVQKKCQMLKPNVKKIGIFRHSLKSTAENKQNARGTLSKSY